MELLTNPADRPEQCPEVASPLDGGTLQIVAHNLASLATSL